MSTDPPPPPPSAPNQPLAPAPGSPPPTGGKTAFSVPGPYPPVENERTMGLLIHLLSIFTSFLGPLIIWLMKREESRYIDHNGKECLNFQISLLIYFAALTILTIVTMGVAILLTGPAMLGLTIVALVFAIICAVKAANGEWPRYPLAIRFLK